jgi:hypothetical protein
MKTFCLFGSAFVVLLCCTTSGFANPTVPSNCDAVAGNLIVNCGFEQNDFNGWTVLNNGDASVIPTTLEQTFTDIIGTTLTFSFYYGSDGNPHSFTALWDGTPVYAVSSAVSTTPQGYTQYSFTETASGSDSIAFIEQNAIGFDALDDVVVVDPPSVPEPSFLGLAIAALAAVILAHRGRTKKTAPVAN